MENKLIGSGETMKIMDVSYPTFLALVNRPDFPAFRIGKKWVIPYAQLMDWMAKQAGGEKA
ncbi:MAG TPA: helix-turn-helix domain-containing protein [Candidatus Limiplasma sp.]|nr:helix-turn-helix domain-containing protein [Candidatus Limiplasma sp.]